MLVRMALPPSSKYLQRPGDPVDETERASITTRLNDAFGDGRITHEEYAAAMDTLADLPSREQLIARLLGSMMSPISGFVIALDQIAKKLGEPAAAAE